MLISDSGLNRLWRCSWVGRESESCSVADVCFSMGSCTRKLTGICFWGEVRSLAGCLRRGSPIWWF